MNCTCVIWWSFFQHNYGIYQLFVCVSGTVQRGLDTNICWIHCHPKYKWYRFGDLMLLVRVICTEAAGVNSNFDMHILYDILCLIFSGQKESLKKIINLGGAQNCPTSKEKYNQYDPWFCFNYVNRYRKEIRNKVQKCALRGIAKTTFYNRDQVSLELNFKRLACRQVIVWKNVCVILTPTEKNMSFCTQMGTVHNNASALLIDFLFFFFFLFF